MEHGEKERAAAVFARLLRRHMRRPLKISAIFLGAMAFGMFCYFFRPFSETPVEAQSASSPSATTGRVESLIVKPVGSPFAASVLEVHARPGQKVKKGDLLLTMDTSELRQEASLAEAEAVSALEAYRLGKQQRDQELAGLKAQAAEYGAQLAESQRVAQEWQAYAAATTAAGGYATVPQDPADLGFVQARLAEVQAELKRRADEWDGMLYQSWLAHANAKKEVKRLEGLIAAAKRTSPIDGVVSEVAAAPGQWLEAFQPAVKVDDPAGFRLVTLVDGQVAAGYKPDTRMAVQLPGGKGEGRLEKVVPGWDRELGYSYLWVKPDHADGLMPGQQAYVALHRQGMMVASN